MMILIKVIFQNSVIGIPYSSLFNKSSLSIAIPFIKKIRYCNVNKKRRATLIENFAKIK